MMPDYSKPITAAAGEAGANIPNMEPETPVSDPLTLAEMYARKREEENQ